MISRIEWFQRAVGLKGGRFRQTGMPGLNIVVGTLLGILSGKYIFEEPLRHYWSEENQRQLEEASGSGSSCDMVGGGVATPPPTTTTTVTQKVGKS